jgi:hypothetical protein
VSIYETNGRNTSRNTQGPVTLDGLDPTTIRCFALYLLEKPDDLERRLEVSNFMARCGELETMRQHLRELEADA